MMDMCGKCDEDEEREEIHKGKLTEKGISREGWRGTERGGVMGEKVVLERERAGERGR